MPDVSQVARSRLWRLTLMYRDADEHEDARERLRRTYLDLREKVAPIASSIQKSLPQYTVHDISHSESLWSLADLFIGAGVSFNPAEAFVLGCSFLIHDLALSSLTYPRETAALRSDREFQDLLGFVYRRTGRLPPSNPKDRIDPEMEMQAFQLLIREKHAQKAEHLATNSLTSAGRPLYLIDNEGIRSALGHIIGRIAYSHWWSLADVGKHFPRIIHAPAFLPPEWTIDATKVACILRLADAAHLDHRRAPTTLLLLQPLERESEMHWKFQNKLNPPSVEGDQLVFSSQPFGPQEYQEWWFCYETLVNLDAQIRQTNSFLFDTAKPYHMAVRSVRGAQAPWELAKDVPVDGWIPTEVRVKASNTLGLILRLGGEELYGRDSTVPLRELIQNGCDAIQARRALGAAGDDQGEINIRYGISSGQEWIEVEDDGVGMSIEVLTRTLLDFGSSIWSSVELLKEYPGLAASGFESRGRFGIGFFSTLMIADSIVVRSRRYDLGKTDTYVLHIVKKNLDRPLVRRAGPDEQLSNGGTIVRLYLREGLTINEDLLGPTRGGKPTWSLKNKIEFLVPASEVTIRVAEKGVAIAANDWKTCSPSTIVDRAKPLGRIPFFDMVPGIAQDLVNEMLQDIVEEGRLLGRMALDPFGEFWCAICERGIRVGVLDNSAGIVLGTARNAARNDAVPQIGLRTLAEWATKQAECFKRVIRDTMDLGDMLESLENRLALLVSMCGGEYRQLLAAYTSAGWVTFRELEAVDDWPDEIVLMPRAAWDKLRLTNPRFKLPQNIWITSVWDEAIHLGREDWDHWPSNALPDMDPVDPASPTDHFPMNWKENYSVLIAKSLARAWGKSLNETLSVYDGSTSKKSVHDTTGIHDNTLDIIRGTPITRPFHIIRNPNVWVLRTHEVTRR